ncbi:hypothetical protein [Paraburkholderia ferrariae]|uniref:hypothetical protein n=1 Tax=Paraburkholderia ferrariae TaxID=386056 RepID=UPI0004886F57|nr:hypothetical protein [Paraburkholderia ferrariae]
MRFEKAFFDLQVRFALAAVRIAGVPLERALLDYTNLYVRFGAGREFDPEHPLWAGYLEGVGAARDVVAWTWQYLQQCPMHLGAPRVVASRGCFSYEPAGEGAVRLHFDGRIPGDASPLAAAQALVRRGELRALFALLREHAGGTDPLVYGTSWLYNLDAYRRLFPAAYLTGAQPVARLRALSLWGQCVDRHGRLRVAVADEIMKRASRLGKGDGLEACFPLQALAVMAPAPVFYEDLA